MPDNFTITDMPLSVGLFRKRVEAFLAENGLRLEVVDSYHVIEDAGGRILAGGGLSGDVIKCIAVSEQARGEGLMGQLVSYLLSQAAAAGHSQVKVYTKPSNRALFADLGFRLVGEAPGMVLMENGRGLQEYCTRLAAQAAGGRCGAIVMNADPMTLGHLHLIRQAAARVDRLFVIVLGGDRSRFPADVRLALVRGVCRELDHVTVLSGGEYCISPSTFPSYFLKNLDEAAGQQMRLDLDVFGRHVAPALRCQVRFVGSEPLDPMTARYNALMHEVLGAYGVEVCELPRLEADGRPVSASSVRRMLDAGDLEGACRLCPGQVRWYLTGDVAAAALRRELDAPHKPGMVSPQGQGSHEDMDYDLMLRSIAALRPWLVRLAAMALDAEVPSAETLREAGLAAERDMLRATGGVNTHKGALFALGLTACCAGYVLKEDGCIAPRRLSGKIRAMASGLSADARVAGRQTHGTRIAREHAVKGALDMALDGYRDLFDDWLPFWRSVRDEEYGLQKTLLRILSVLDDTCVIHRAGFARAQEIKAEAAALLADFDLRKLKDTDRRFISERVSPGGSADMLALTIYAELICNNT